MAPCVSGLAGLAAAVSVLLAGAAPSLSHDDQAGQLNLVRQTSSKARVLDGIRNNPELHQVFFYLKSADAAFNQGVMKQVTHSVPNPAEELFMRRTIMVPGMDLFPQGADTNHEDASKSAMVASDPIGMMDQLLDALGSDDFVRNFTKMSGEVQDLGHWLVEQGNQIIQDMEALSVNATEQGMKYPVEDFMRRFRTAGMDLMAGTSSIWANFTLEVPAGLLKGTKDVTKDVPDLVQSSLEASGNMTQFVDLMKTLPRPNMSKVDAHVFCRLFNLMQRADQEITKANKGIMKSMNMSRRMMPTIAKSFKNMLPPDDAEAQEMAPRLLFVLGQSIDYTYSLLDSWSEFNHLMNGVAVPFSYKRLGCEEHLKKRDKQSNMEEFSGSPRSAGLGLLAIAAAALSSRVLL